MSHSLAPLDAPCRNNKTKQGLQLLDQPALHSLVHNHLLVLSGLCQALQHLPWPAAFEVLPLRAQNYIGPQSGNAHPSIYREHRLLACRRLDQ